MKFTPGNGSYKAVSLAADADIIDSISGKLFKQSSGSAAVFTKVNISSQDVTFTDGESIASKIDKLLAITELKDVLYVEHAPPMTSIRNSLRSIKSGLANIREKYNSINDQVEKLFGKRYEDGTLTNNVTLKNVQDFVTYLNSEISEKDFQNDETISLYNTIKGDLLVIEENYNITKAIYSGIRNKPSQGLYLADFDFVDDFTPTNLYRLSSFSIKKDTDARKNIVQEVQQLDDSYLQVQDSFDLSVENLEIFQG